MIHHRNPTQARYPLLQVFRQFLHPEPTELVRLLHPRHPLWDHAKREATNRVSQFHICECPHYISSRLFAVIEDVTLLVYKHFFTLPWAFRLLATDIVEKPVIPNEIIIPQAVDQ